MVPIRPEQKAELDGYARPHGQDPASALDQVLAEALECGREDYNETVAAVSEAYKSVQAGRTRPADEALEELRAKHGFPG